MENSTEINLNINSDTVLFFDMDGTLIDTDFANFLSYQEAIKSVTQSETEIQYVPNERFNRTTLNKVIPNLTEEKIVEIIKQKEINYNKYLTQTKLNKSVSDILIRYSKTNKTVFEPYIIKQYDDIKVAYLGITTPKTITSSSPKYFQDSDGNYIFWFCRRYERTFLFYNSRFG